MAVNQSLTADGVHYTLAAENTMGLSAAEPEPTNVIHVAHIADPVPETIFIFYLAGQILLFIAVISTGYHVSLDDNFAYLSRDQVWRNPPDLSVRASVASIILSDIPGNGLPTQVPLPFRVLLQVSSRPSLTLY